MKGTNGQNGQLEQQAADIVHIYRMYLLKQPVRHQYLPLRQAPSTLHIARLPFDISADAARSSST